MIKHHILPLICLLLASCMVGPTYQTPERKLPEQWQTTPAHDGQSAELTQWWLGFKAPKLSALISRALSGNLDLQAAKARLQGARALSEATGAQLWPSVNAFSAYQRQRISPNALLGALGSIQGGNTGDNSQLLSTLGPIGTPFNLLQAGFDASWELDLFGGIRRQQQAADANLAAITASAYDVQITLSAEIARHYLELHALECRLQIANERLNNQREVQRFVQQQYQAGWASALQLQSTQTELQALSSALPPLQAQRQNTHHALALLLGRPPQALEQELQSLPAQIPAPPNIALGMPADLLRRRPDIRQAERLAAAASANIGVAVAELFPKIALTGTAGLQSQDLSNFTNLSSGFYGFGPRLSLPIFQMGRIQANIAAQAAQSRAALAVYDKTVLNALREVEDQLALIQSEQQRQQALQAAEQSAHTSIVSAQALYHEGEADWESVLNARKVWLDLREQLLYSQLGWATAHVSLFKALGGGWAAQANPLPTPAADLS